MNSEHLLFPNVPLLGSMEVKLSRYVILGRCYRLGDLLFMNQLDWDQGPEHCATLRVIDLGDHRIPGPLTLAPLPFRGID